MEYFYKDKGNKRFTVEAGVAVLEITKFSELRLSSTITSAAMVNGESYSTLQEAIDVASNGDTIEVLAENQSATVRGRKTFTLTGAGAESAKLSAASGYRLSKNGNEYTVSKKSSGSSSDSSSTSEKTYSVSAEKSDNGSVKLSDSKAAKGDTVTITVKPDAGYQLNWLTVMDADGKAVKLKDKGEGKYTFIMPASKITIEAFFVPAFDVEPTQTTVHPFTDVATGTWIDTAVQYVYANGLMTGTGADTFAPKAGATRAETAAMLMRFCEANQ